MDAFLSVLCLWFILPVQLLAHEEFAWRHTCQTPEIVQHQYDEYPYPQLTAIDEELASPISSSIPYVVDRVYSGETPSFWRNGTSVETPQYRALYVGVGSGTPIISHLIQLNELGIVNTEIVAVDISTNTLELVKRRLERFLPGQGDRVQFIHGNLLDIQRSEHGLFHHINAEGVVHHLPDPTLATKTLSTLLVPDGYASFMVYAKYGRDGVYALQQVYRSIGLVGANALPIAMELYDSLDESSWIVESTKHFPDTGKAGDFVDMFLHHCDFAFTITEVYQMALAAGFQTLVPMKSSVYKIPDSVLNQISAHNESLKVFEALSDVEKLELGEILSQAVDKHGVFLSKLKLTDSAPAIDSDWQIVVLERPRLDIKILRKAVPHPYLLELLYLTETLTLAEAFEFNNLLGQTPNLPFHTFCKGVLEFRDFGQQFGLYVIAIWKGI